MQTWLIDPERRIAEYHVGYEVDREAGLKKLDAAVGRALGHAR